MLPSYCLMDEESLVCHLVQSSELNSSELFCKVMLRYIEISTHIGYIYIYPKLINTVEI